MIAGAEAEATMSRALLPPREDWHRDLTLGPRGVEPCLSQVEVAQ